MRIWGWVERRLPLALPRRRVTGGGLNHWRRGDLRLAQQPQIVVVTLFPKKAHKVDVDSL